MQVKKHVINFTMSAIFVNSLDVFKKTNKAFPSNALKSLLLCAGLLGLSNSLHAEDAPRYTVEMVVFENYALQGWTEEHWPDEIESPSMENSTALSTLGKAPLYLQGRQTSLDAVVKRMGSGYRILFHQAWSQNAYESKDAPKITIENDRTGGSQVKGTVKLNKTRFAHIEIDLEFEKVIPNKIRQTFAKNQQLDLGDVPSHWRFNLKEARKIKEGELHYIDHPLFGVLFQLHKND